MKYIKNNVSVQTQSKYCVKVYPILHEISLEIGFELLLWHFHITGKEIILILSKSFVVLFYTDLRIYAMYNLQMAMERKYVKKFKHLVVISM